MVFAGDFSRSKAGREDKERYGKAVVGCTIGFWVPLRAYVRAARTVGGANEGDGPQQIVAVTPNCGPGAYGEYVNSEY